MSKTKNILFLSIIIIWSLFSNINVANSKTKLAALTYSGSNSSGLAFVNRNYNLSIGAALLNTINIRYATISTYRGNESAQNPLIANASVSIQSIQPMGGECSNGQVTTVTSGNPIQFCGWNQMRKSPDFTKPATWQWVITKYFNTMGNDAAGVMEDECVMYYHPNWGYPGNGMTFPYPPGKWMNGSSVSNVQGWQGRSWTAVRDSLLFLKQKVWLPMLMDTLNKTHKYRFANPAAYGVLGSDVITDVKLTGTGVLFGEGMQLRPTYTNWAAECWNVMDYIASGNKGYAIIWLEIMSQDSVALGSWSRCQMERLCYYYMAADTSHFWMLLTGNETWLMPNDYRGADSLYKFNKAFNYDVGNPTSVRRTAQQGNDPAGQSYKIYARDFEKGLVLYRPVAGTNYGDNTKVQIHLGGDYIYRQLLPNGQLSTEKYKYADMRNGEGKVFVLDNVPPPPPPIPSKHYQINVYIQTDSVSGIKVDSTKVVK